MAPHPRTGERRQLRRSLLLDRLPAAMLERICGNSVALSQHRGAPHPAISRLSPPNPALGNENFEENVRPTTASRQTIRLRQRGPQQASPQHARFSRAGVGARCRVGGVESAGFSSWFFCVPLRPLRPLR
jgi:hypothetical protein